MNMVPKEVGYKDETKELTDVMPTFETFELFPDGLLLDLEREMEQCMQVSIWDSILRDTTNSPPYRQLKGVELSSFQTGGSGDLYRSLMQHPGFIDLIRRDGVPLEPQWVDDVDFALLII